MRKLTASVITAALLVTGVSAPAFADQAKDDNMSAKAKATVSSMEGDKKGKDGEDNGVSAKIKKAVGSSEEGDKKGKDGDNKAPMIIGIVAAVAVLGAIAGVVSGAIKVPGMPAMPMAH